ncbi:hypothetical protein DMC25_22760 [Caulobacter sp. D4A]|uniref:ExbD/TolR family protein n=1 Tax=unclassified Caulobacter TaxID=2648921 RepID=UPI000D7311BC|nr:MULTISPECIES: biopolymer transporter ExbD [unclassified Caulobacter]PXA78111.1 hypothetical protein DMC25_22760 [Caulobacter sp. D4A]PXA92725.1 hypothetical protein DMC18_10285 [Caulobacter sp. D5]
MAQRLAGRFENEPLKAMNLAPMIGVLLAVFTVVTATSVGLGKPVNLYVEPGSVPPPADEWAGLPLPVTIFVQRDGTVYLGPDRVSGIDEAVGRAVVRARAQNSDVVSLRADPEVRYETIVWAVRSLNAKGFQAQFINEEIH